MINKAIRFLLAVVPGLIVAGLGTLQSAHATLPEPWQVNLQQAASPVMERVHEFHSMLMVIVTGIVLLVLGILAYIIFRFNERKNPVPSRTAHNTLLEILWTAVPIIILVIIAVPSFKLLYFSDRTANPGLTLKVTGHQWYWTYTYPEQEIAFDSIPVPADDLKPGEPRLLTVDNRVVLPIDTDVQVLINSDDVIHNWAVPALGLKKDATPGRTNETWVRINKEGTYYGMCSELCGVNHYFMPIQIEAVSKEKFAAWLLEAKEKFAMAPTPSLDRATVDAR